MKEAKISTERVNRCMEDSVDGDDIDVDDNSILRDQFALWKKTSLGLHPLIIINEQVYRGDIEAEEVQVALCAGIETPPDFCLSDEPADKDKSDDDSDSADSARISNTWLIVLCITLVVIVTLVLVVVCWRFWMKKDLESDMKGQIDMAVN